MTSWFRARERHERRRKKYRSSFNRVHHSAAFSFLRKRHPLFFVCGCNLPARPTLLTKKLDGSAPGSLPNRLSVQYEFVRETRETAEKNIATVSTESIPPRFLFAKATSFFRLWLEPSCPSPSLDTKARRFSARFLAKPIWCATRVREEAMSVDGLPCSRCAATWCDENLCRPTTQVHATKEHPRVPTR